MSKYGVRMSASPAATLHAPTPTFRIEVGYNSAVYTGIIVLPALIVNLPANRIGKMGILIHSSLPCNGLTDHNKGDFEPHEIRLSFHKSSAEARQPSTKECGTEEPLLSYPPNNENRNRNCGHLNQPGQSL